MKVLLNNGERDISIDCPLDCSEITFEAFIDFSFYEQRFFKANSKDIEKKIGATDEAYGNQLIDATERSVEHLITAVGHLVSGDIAEIPFTGGEDIEKLIDEGYILSLANIGDNLSILKLYAHCINLISSYKASTPQIDFVLSWNGTDYMINNTEAIRSLLNVPVTTGELIATLELQRKAINISKKKGDPEGNLAFNMGLQEVSILLRRKGERLPSNRRRRIKFIDERVKVFRKLPMDIVLDLRFFLLNSMKDYLKTQLTNSSFTRQRELVRQQRKERLSKNLERSQKLSGK